MKKLFTILALSLICTLCAVDFAACDNSADNRDAQILSVYNTYVAYAEENGETPLSYEEWLKSIKGKDGKDGKDGVSIVKIEKIFSDGLIDTYIITYSDGNTFEFTITKGQNGEKGSDGEKGEKGISIVKIEKTFTSGLTDTYTITFSNETTTTFTVTNGAQGNKGDKGETGTGIKTAALINDELVITLTDDTILYLGNVKGNKGDKGDKGTDGKTPQMRINDKTKVWEVSYDNGTTWVSLGVKATGENGNNGVGIKSATINENGELIITFTDDEKINAGKVKAVHGHEIVEKEIIDKEPTCISIGVKYIVCDTCGELINTVITDKIPHDYDEDVTQPTCTDQGYITYTCKVCGYKIIDNYTAPKGHSYKQEYTYDSIYHWQEVSCGHADAIIKQSHSFDENEVCSVCGYDAKITTALVYVSINGGTEYAVDELDNDQVKVVYIPETYNGKPVTKINDMAFYGKTNLEKVVISDNVTEIGESAFYNCSNLKTLKLSKNLAEIKANTFYRCTALTEITIPDSVTSIGECAFVNCDSFKKIYYTGTVSEWSQIDGLGNLEAYGRTLYINNEPLTNVVLEGITEIKPYAFYYCNSLTSVIIPDSVTSIGEYAFSGCSLTNITIPNSVTSIGEYAFSGCSLTNITIPNSVTSIESYVFYYCNRLTNITIPDSVTSIGENAFGYCWSLTNITIPNGVTSIGENAFRYCSSLTSVTIPDSVTGMWNSSFDGCPCVTTSKGLSYVDKWLVAADGNITAYTIKEGTVGIASGTFRYFNSLTSITIPDSVKIIGNNAFESCRSLNSITIPNSVRIIGDWAFALCSYLTSIEFNGSIEQWNEIDKINDWHYASRNITVHCTDGDINI